MPESTKLPPSYVFAVRCPVLTQAIQLDGMLQRLEMIEQSKMPGIGLRPWHAMSGTDLAPPSYQPCGCCP